MTLSMYQNSIPVFIHKFENLSNILKKGEAYANENKLDLTTAKLAEDMFPLTRQVQIACDVAKGGAARLAGVEIPSFEDNEKTFDELQARIAKTVAFLKTIPAEKVDGSENKQVSLKVGGKDLTFKGQDYLLDFVIPNVYFHITTAYGILRNAGVPVGKMDYLGAIQP